MNTEDVDRVLALVRAYGTAARETEKLRRSGHRVEAALRANKRAELYKDIGLELYQLAREDQREDGATA